MARAFERALRRAGVPMAYSQGFNPHPKISWAGAAPTGVASEAEYVEIQLVERVDPEVLRAELDAALPDGLDVLQVVPASGGSLADRLDASLWRIELPGVDPRALAEAVDRLLAADRVEVQRLTKDGRRTIDVRPAVVTAEAASSVAGAGGSPDRVESGPLRRRFPDDEEIASNGTSVPGRGERTADNVAHGSQIGTRAARTDDWPAPGRPCGILVTVVRQATPAVRPDDVLSALRVVAGLEPPVPAKATRMAQGQLDDDGRLADPLAPVAAPQPATRDGESGQGVVAGPAV
ncbi:radical SAM protein [Gandjariella thermophila]|uniref:Radical SAM protein n=1 Tax=Gandjariella thermophila TaxID=1931992 RepID=A0A4D4J8Y1_9PSEU|nr:radical SAM protein [Gandjariella thermophila]